MTNLTKLTKSLNLQVLTSNETISLKGGKKGGNFNFNATPPPPTKPVGGGNPPKLEGSLGVIF